MEVPFQYLHADEERTLLVAIERKEKSIFELEVMVIEGHWLFVN